MLLYWILGLMVLQQMSILEAKKFNGDACMSKGSNGICREWGECPVIKTLIESGEYKKSEVVSCGLGIKEELICCPVIGNEGSAVQNENRFEGSSGPAMNDQNPNNLDQNQIQDLIKDVFGITESVNDNNQPVTESSNMEQNHEKNLDDSHTSPKPNATQPRPAVRACQRFETNLTASLTNVSLDPHVKRGEFPHVVVIGYKRSDKDDKNPYKMLCSGSLIDKRFVLTVAHCVQRGDVQLIVRLGAVNFSDPEELSTTVEMKIKNTHIHPSYLSRLAYNDIAILELEQDVETNEYIYPICLYTNEEDPDTNIQLWVTGWGHFNKNITNKDILRKAPMNTCPLEKCNKIYKERGLTRVIAEGIKSTQLCAEDKEEELKDICLGESGGPLMKIEDETSRNYRLVGLVSAGFECAARMPGLYTRVAAFLDFIEPIVWSNGGD